MVEAGYKPDLKLKQLFIVSFVFATNLKFCLSKYFIKSIAMLIKNKEIQ